MILDEIVVSTGEGSTGFEADGNTLDGWTTPAAPDRHQPNPNTWIPVGLRARRPGTGRRRAAVVRPPARDHRLGGRPCSGRIRGGVGRRRPGRRRRVRPREPDPTGLFAVLLRPERGQRLRRRPRARPPVVRRPPRGRHLERDLAERGLRDLRRMDVGRARGLLHAAGRLGRPDVDPGRRRVLGPARSATRASRTSSPARSTTAAR